MTHPNSHEQNNPTGSERIVDTEKQPWYKKAGCLIPLLAALLIALAILIFFAACGDEVENEVDEASNEISNEVDEATDEVSDEYTEASREATDPKAVVYMIDGDAQSAMVKYVVAEGQTETEEGLAAGWSKEIPVEDFFAASLTATNGDDDNGELTCMIQVDGETLAEDTVSGAGESVSCAVAAEELEDNE
ncbi:MmpS family protein [Corynebacterium sp. TAE3-ERU12]|uniref:MmpS family transport accessory protein n=1 Tax=Corynebacterium sp. TAE3-ERU12 TaxID=2849491 RepID=UPI001C452B14|nr:MmpS family transport accessory protein [Corynebacterium sp. TAE3-ERU12]MBV7294951.1 MmpS family protein [Corynebacterium sp. TAE3-ERU12]